MRAFIIIAGLLVAGIAYRIYSAVDEPGLTPVDETNVADPQAQFWLDRRPCLSEAARWLQCSVPPHFGLMHDFDGLDVLAASDIVSKKFSPGACPSLSKGKI
jgi:hypothetical protein